MSTAGRLLQRAADGLALLGGAALLAAALMTCVSIAGRALAGAPILGDVELMQIGCAVAIACCLPYCQIQAGHVKVDFFTQRASPATVRRLDRIGHALVAVLMLLLAWRAGVGVADMKAVGETTMLLGVPAWLAYLALVPGLLLTGLIALHAAAVGATPAAEATL